MAFEEGQDIKSVVLDTLYGGLSGFAGRYVYDTVVGKPLVNALKSTGKYADVVASFIFGAVLNYAGAYVGGKGGEALKVAGYVPIADALGRLFGDAPVMASKTVSKGVNWGSLNPINLEEVKM